MNYDSFFVETPDNIKLHITRHEHTALNCVLLHGFGEGSFIWESFRESISSISSTIAIDLRGHGNSDWDPKCAYRQEIYASDASLVLSEIKAPNKILVGHSLGGNVCVQLAKRMRHSLRALVLVDCSPEVDPESAAHILNDFHEEHRIYSSPDEYSNFLRMKRPLIDKSTSMKFAHGALRKMNDGFYCLKRDQALGQPAHWGIHNPETWKNLDTINCPVLLLRGSASAILQPGTGQNLAAQFRNCTYRTIGMAGHSIMLDNPKDFNAEMDLFLRHIVLGHVAKPY